MRFKHWQFTQHLWNDSQKVKLMPLTTSLWNCPWWQPFGFQCRVVEVENVIYLRCAACFPVCPNCGSNPFDLYLAARSRVELSNSKGYTTRESTFEIRSWKLWFGGSKWNWSFRSRSSFLPWFTRSSSNSTPTSLGHYPSFPWWRCPFQLFGLRAALPQPTESRCLWRNRWRYRGAKRGKEFWWKLQPLELWTTTRSTTLTGKGGNGRNGITKGTKNTTTHCNTLQDCLWAK